MERIKNKIKKLGEEQVKLNAEIKEKTFSYFLAALGFVAGLAWNEAIKSLIDHIFPYSKNSVLAKFIYAFVLTMVIVVVSVYLLKTTQKKDKIKK